MADNRPTNLTDNRPLSPHLQIYKPEINMVMSIAHRLTGIGLFLGTLVLVWWLTAAATGPAYYEFVRGLLASWLGRLVLFGFTFALMFHMLGGIRHLIWDTGKGLDLKTVDRLGWLTLIGAIILTFVIWFAAYSSMGAFK